MIKVYVVVRADNQQFVGVFGTRRGAELFTEAFRVPTEILEEEVINLGQ